jgi:hypothetical protein
MTRNRFALGAAFVALLVLLWVTGGVVAGPPAEGPGGDVTIAATVSSKISYQGVLKENGNPVTGSRNMTFRLYSDNTCTTQVGSDIVKSGVQVTNGLFSVELDVNPSYFNGQGLWLKVLVGDTGLGCQEILPVPYALSLRPGARIQDGSTSANLVTAEPGGGWPPILYPVGVKGEGTWGVYGYSTDAIGVRGETGTSATSGTGVYGLAQATSGTTYGVYGKAQSTDGYGGYFENSASGIGLYGYCSATSGTKCIGLYGKSDSSGGTGVQASAPFWGVDAVATATSGGNYGVRGRSSSPDGYAGYFLNTSDDGIALYAKGSGSTRNKATLRVENTEPDKGMAAYLTNNSNFATAHFSNAGNGEVLYLQNGGTDAAGTGGGDFIKAVNKPEGDIQFRVTTSGEVYADGSFHPGGADFAELLPAVEGLEPGDVLVVSADGRLARSTQAYQPTVVGVYSTRPGFVGGQPVEGELEGHIPLAVVGVVPVKASAENGPIKPGDLLTSASIPGHAMKATDLKIGTIIGKALEGLNEGTGVIKMLVMLQ